MVPQPSSERRAFLSPIVLEGPLRPPPLLQQGGGKDSRSPDNPLEHHTGKERGDSSCDGLTGHHGAPPENGSLCPPTQTEGKGDGPSIRKTIYWPSSSCTQFKCACWKQGSGPWFCPSTQRSLVPNEKCLLTEWFPQFLPPRAGCPHCTHIVKVEVNSLQVDSTLKWSCYWTLKPGEETWQH
jgi:hypothetical protein